MKKRHIIFDMDGTLSNTAKATLTAIDQVRDRFILPPIDDSGVRDAMGIAGLDFFRKMFPTVAEDVIVKLGPEVDALELASIQSLGATVLFPGVIEMLETLRQAGIKMYIASTGSHVHVDGTLQATGIKHYFEGIYSGEPAKIDMVRRILGDACPSEWAMVGDMYKDSEAARGSNMMALGAGFGYLAEEDHPLFDAVLTTPADLQKYV